MFAYVQVALDSAKEENIYQELKAMPEVKEVNILFGEWDILAKLEIESPGNLAAFVMEKIRPISGIKMTSTLIVAK